MRDETKPVGILSQMVIGFFIPLVSFYRIKKLQSGIIWVIIGAFIGYGTVMGVIFLDPGSLWSVYMTGLIITFVPIILPMYFIYKWSKEWNEKAQSLSGNNLENP